MISSAKASAFVIIKRNDGRIYCTVERASNGEDVLGVPGGKWDPEIDGKDWKTVIAREFQEEIGVELPSATAEGYFEWGNARYQIRFMTMHVSEAVARTLPADVPLTSDPDSSVRSACWLRMRNMTGLRRHVRTAMHMMRVMGDMQNELFAKNPTVCGQTSSETAASESMASESAENESMASESAANESGSE